MAGIKKTPATIPNGRHIIFFSHYPFPKSARCRTHNADDVQALFAGGTPLATVGGHFRNTEWRQNGVFRVDGKLDVTTRFKAVKT